MYNFVKCFFAILICKFIGNILSQSESGFKKLYSVGTDHVNSGKLCIFTNSFIRPGNRLATSRLAGFFFSKPNAEGASKLQKQKENERQRRERAAKCRRHEKRADLSTLLEILSHDVILPRIFTFLKFQWMVLKLKSETTS